MSPLRDAIQELSDFDKASYMEALERCPKLVESESPENRFLAVDDGDVVKAARRLAMYWKMEKA